MKLLGQQLKECRMNMDLTQYDIASILKTDRSTYTLYETGKITPSITTLLKLAKIYNVPCTDFVKVINKEAGLEAPVLKEDLYEYRKKRKQTRKKINL